MQCWNWCSGVYKGAQYVLICCGIIKKKKPEARGVDVPEPHTFPWHVLEEVSPLARVVEVCKCSPNYHFPHVLLLLSSGIPLFLLVWKCVYVCVSLEFNSIFLHICCIYCMYIYTECVFVCVCGFVFGWQLIKISWKRRQKVFWDGTFPEHVCRRKQYLL